MSKKISIQKKMKKMKFIDLFSGIGGFRQGLDLSNGDFECVLSCEIDKYARKVYSNLYNVKESFDIEKVKYQLENNNLDTQNEVFFKDIKHLASLEKEDFFRLANTDEIDLICGGFPCQPFSRSGKRRGFKDENKGNLFFNILDVIKKTKPKSVLLENVKGLLTIGESVPVEENEFGSQHNRTREINKGKSFLDIIYYLINSGYYVQWQVLNSNSIIPHKRQRVFIYAHRLDLEYRSVFPIILDEKQSEKYKSEQELISKIPINKILVTLDKTFEKYRVKSVAENPDLIQYYTGEKYKFNGKSPFQNWGMAFPYNNENYLITKKLDSEIDDSNKLKMIDLLETDFEIIKHSNISHIYILKQLWSKSAKVASTMNKMGNMKYPDSPLKPCRTLTATDSLGREAIILGYYYNSNNQIKYVLPFEPITNRYQLLKMSVEQSSHDDFEKIKEKFKNRNNKDFVTEIEIVDKDYITVKVKDIDNKVVDLSYSLNGKSKKEKNRLYFRKLTALERWKLQGFIDDRKNFNENFRNSTESISNYNDLIKLVGEGQLIKQAGNAVTVNVIRKIADSISEV